MRFIALVAFTAVFVLTSCGMRSDNEVRMADEPVVEASSFPEPPNAAGTVGNQEISFVKGSYQWLNGIADAPAPDDLVKDTTPYVVESGAELTLAFEGEEPLEVWGGLWENRNFKPLPGKNSKFRLPSEPGLYVLSVGGKWPEGHGSYAALIEVQGSIQGSISKKHAEQIAWEYVADEASHWNLTEIEEVNQAWVVRFSPVSPMPELLWLYIDQETGEIDKVITDS